MNFSFTKLEVPTPRITEFGLFTMMIFQKNSIFERNRRQHGALNHLDVNSEEADLGHERARTTIGRQILLRRCAYQPSYSILIKHRKCP